MGGCMDGRMAEEMNDSTIPLAPVPGAGRGRRMTGLSSAPFLFCLSLPLGSGSGNERGSSSGGFVSVDDGDGNRKPWEVGRRRDKRAHVQLCVMRVPAAAGHLQRLVDCWTARSPTKHAATPALSLAASPKKGEREAWRANRGCAPSARSNCFETKLGRWGQ